MIQLGADETREARKRDESFGFAGILVGDSAAVQVGAQHEIRGEHGAGDHQPESGDCEAADVEKWDHRRQYNVIGRRRQEGREAAEL